jgi:SMODS and SLOG-associating 2TM effector domain 1
MTSFVAGAISVAFGAAAAFYPQRFAEGIAALTTIAAAVTAYGLIDRRKYLAASYAAIATNLERMKERYAAGDMSLQGLVAAAEDLMESEHAAWIDQMTKTIRPAPSPPPAAGAPHGAAEPKAE